MEEISDSVPLPPVESELVRAAKPPVDSELVFNPRSRQRQKN